jgi:hypothetical protein
MTALPDLLHLIQRIIIVFLLAAAGTCLLWISSGDYDHDLAALINKRDLLKAKKPPRIIFIGGSNLSTLESMHIERGLDKTGCSVVNLGLWGGLNMAQYLEEIKPHLSPGDSVVICQEYGTLLSAQYFTFIRHNKEADKFFFLMRPEQVFQNDFNYNNFLYGAQYIILLNQMKIRTYLHVLINGDFSHSCTGGFYHYTRDYNTHGDRRFPFKIVRPLGESGVRLQEPDQENLQYLKYFNIYARAHDIRVFFSFPPFPANDYILNRRQIESLSHVIGNDLGLEILTKPEATVYPESCFANTVNHLQPGCEKKRTSILLEQLYRHLKGHQKN